MLTRHTMTHWGVVWGLAWGFCEGAFRVLQGESAQLLVTTPAIFLPVVLALAVLGAYLDWAWMPHWRTWSATPKWRNTWMTGGLVLVASFAIWAVLQFGLMTLVSSKIQRDHFKAALSALGGVGLFGGVALAGPVLWRGAAHVVAFLTRRPRRLRWVLGAVAVLSVGGSVVAFRWVPVLGRLPWAYAVGPAAGLAITWAVSRVWTRPSARATRRWFAVAAAAHTVLALAPSRFAHVRETLSAQTSVAALEMRVLLRATDFDRDGESSLYMSRDCAGLDPERSTAAYDVPGNGVDEDCDGEDMSLADLPAQGPTHVPIEAKRPSVVVITTDALSYAHTSLGGYAHDVTPKLKAFAEDAVWFTNAWANSPTTYMSLPIIQTGMEFTDLKVLSGPVEGGYQFGLDASTPTLGHAFKKLGYKTIFVPGHAYFGPNNWPGLGVGFDEIDTAAPTGFAHSAKNVTDRVLKHLTEATEPIYLWVHYFDHHEPYVRGRGFKKFPAPAGPLGDKVAAYDAEVEATDREWGRLLDYLASKPDDYVVVFTSDHGETFDELHREKPHSHCIRSSETHVPLVIAAPGHKPGKVDGLVAHMDIAPTLLNIVGVKPLDKVRGETLVPSIFHGTPPQKQAVFLSYYDPRRTDPKEAFMQYGAVSDTYLYFRDRDASIVATYATSDPLQKDGVASTPESEVLRRFAEYRFHLGTQDPAGLFNRK